MTFRKVVFSYTENKWVLHR